MFDESDYPLLDVIWTTLIIFLWVIWFFLLIRIIGDVFRRHDIRGVKKAAWVIFLIVFPFLGVFVYLIVNGDDMGHRDVAQAQESRAQFDEYVRSVSGSGGGSASELARAKELLDSGAIDQAEFDALKRKVLA